MKQFFLCSAHLNFGNMNTFLHLNQCKCKYFFSKGQSLNTYALEMHKIIKIQIFCTDHINSWKFTLICEQVLKATHACVHPQ